jgi:hypothetical protein
MWRANRRYGYLVAGALLALACYPTTPVQTACDGLADRELGITREEYSPCAAELLHTLDTLQRALERMIVRGDSTGQSDARAAYQHLRLLMQRVGFQADIRREMPGPGRLIERWPDAAMRQFNAEIGTAAAQYMSALNYPNVGNLQEGSRRHELARQAYSRFR